MYDGNPPTTWDALECIARMIRGAAAKAERAGGDGSVDPTWAHRVEQALWHAAELCRLARVDGAVLPVRPPPAGASVEVTDTAPPLVPPNVWLRQRR